MKKPRKKEAAPPAKLVRPPSSSAGQMMLEGLFLLGVGAARYVAQHPELFAKKAPCQPPASCHKPTIEGPIGSVRVTGKADVLSSLGLSEGDSIEDFYWRPREKP